MTKWEWNTNKKISLKTLFITCKKNSVLRTGKVLLPLYVQYPWKIVKIVSIYTRWDFKITFHIHKYYVKIVNIHLQIDHSRECNYTNYLHTFAIILEQASICYVITNETPRNSWYEYLRKWNNYSKPNIISNRFSVPASFACIKAWRRFTGTSSSSTSSSWGSSIFSSSSSSSSFWWMSSQS